MDSTRQQWQDGLRRLAESASDPVRYAQLQDLVAAVLAELRRRLGSKFTLAELESLHREADDWVREVVLDSLPEEPRVGVGDAPLVQDAAFGSYARGAGDWRP